MKTTNFKKTCLIMAVCLGGAAFTFAQPVVKVPPMCEVVYAGTGAGVTPGFGGIVGDGGIVAMPDPFDLTTSAGDFYYVSNDTELIEWALLGDISMQTETSYNSVLLPTGPVNPINLQSYNKTLRFAENPSASQPLLQARWARSKARITVSYSKKPCVASIKFDILKRYSQNPGAKPPSVVPPIMGSDCVLPNTTYTYSVDQIASDNVNDEIGFDKYYWSGLPEGSIILYSAADNSTITFTTGASVYDFTLKCCYGRANAWDGDAGSSHTTCITKSVGGQPAEPSFTTAPPACLNTGLTSFTVTINPAAIVTGTTYTWSAPGTNWVLTPGGTPSGQTLTVNGIDNNPGTLILTIANGSCLPAVFNYPVNRNYTGTFAITGTACVAGNTTYNYSLPSNGLLNPTIWTAPSGWIVTPTNATASTVNIAIPNAVAGAYTLTAKSNSCAGTTSLTVNIRPSAPVFLSSAPTCVPLSSPSINTFAVTPVAGAVNYTWTLPPGWSCSGNCTSANPSLIPPANTAAIGAPPIPPATISVVANSAAGCSSASGTLTVNYIQINTNTLQSGSGNCDQYSINTNAIPCMGTISSWMIGGVAAVNSATVNIFGNTLTLCGNMAPAAGTVCANVIINGVTYTTCSSSIATGTHGLRQANPKVVLNGVIISPNPNSGHFNIKVADFHENATATLVDFSGNKIQTYELRKGDNPIEKAGLSKGIYFVMLQIDGKQETRQIIINY